MTITESQRRGNVPVMVLATVAVIALFWVGILVANLAGADPGTTPDWIAAVATLAAFGAAVVAGWFAYRALLVEQERDRVRYFLAMRAQAELMLVWPERVLYGIDLGRRAEEDRDQLQVTSVTLHVRNGSSLPITNLRFEVMHYVVGESEPKLLCEKTMPFAQPATVAEGFDGDEIAQLVPVPDRARGAYVRLTFTDAEGRRWRREGMGELELVEASSPSSPATRLHQRSR